MYVSVFILIWSGCDGDIKKSGSNIHNVCMRLFPGKNIMHIDGDDSEVDRGDGMCQQHLTSLILLLLVEK